MRTASEGLAIMGFKAGLAASQFLLLVLTARWFGIAVRGEIALFSASVNLLMLVVGFTGGAGIVYLSAREPSRPHLARLMALSYAFCVLIPAAAVALAPHLPLLGAAIGRRAPLVGTVASLNAMLVVNACVLLSGRAVWQASLLEFLRLFPVMALAVGVALTRGFRSPDEFYVVWTIAAALALVLSLPFVWLHARSLDPAWRGAPVGAGDLLRRLLGYGSLASTSNLVQFLNYRGLFFALEKSAGLATVGLFSTAVAFAEVLWIPVNSLASMALSRVSRDGAARPREAGAFALLLLRVSLAAMLVAALAALVLPVDRVTGLLGRDFAGVRAVLLQLLPGAIVLGVSMVAQAYHAGHGRYVVNIAAASAGLLVTIAGGLFLVPTRGAGGAVLAMNVSYVLTGAWMIAEVLRREGAPASALVPTPADVAALRAARAGGR
ncbi:MAG: hypothetical protein U0704_07025 [Candidatus Eisenbacteria bacterium]